MKEKASEKCKIIFIRHGQTEANVKNLVDGQSLINSPLTEHGRNEVLKAGRRLKLEKISHIFSSDQQRAVQTAEILAKENDNFEGAIILSENFRERHFGVYESMDFGDFYSEVSEKVGSKSLCEVLMYDHESAESVADVEIRALRGIKEITDVINEGEAVLVASHGAFLIYLAMVIRDHFECPIPDLAPAMKSPKNTALLEFSWHKREEKFDCETFFCCQHLNLN